MSWVTPIGSAPEQVDYRLGQQHGCVTGISGDAQLEYRTDAERPLIWIGQALADLGIEAGTELTAEHFPLARAMMDGYHPRSGEQLVEHKLGVPIEAKVPIAQLVRMIEGVAREAQADVSEVLRHRQGRWSGTTSKRMLDMFNRAKRSVGRHGETAMLRADHAGQLADAAELRLATVWDPGVFEGAAVNLTKTITITAKDGTQSDAVVDNRIIIGNRGYDITLTLPKSFSLLREFVDEDTGNALDAIYLEQGGATFAWLETNTAYGMRGHHGDGSTAEKVPGNGFAGWAMIHPAARPAAGQCCGDPHWHVHYTITNMTKGFDGKWSTVAAGGRDLMRHIPAAAKLLDGSVRHVLTQRYGVAWRRSERTGQWEIASIPDAAIKEFSQRGADIHAMLLDLGFTEQDASQSLKRMVKQETRQAKNDTSEPQLTRRERNRQRAIDAGLDPDSMAQDAHIPGMPEEATRQPTINELATALQDVERGLTAHSRRFSRVDALAAVVDQLPNGAQHHTVETLTDEVLRHNGFVPLISIDNDDDSPAAGVGERHQLGADHMTNAQLYTTQDIVTAEKTIIAAAQASHEDQTPIRVSRTTAEMAADTIEATNGFTLSTEQRRELLNIVTSGQAIDALIGGPGSGKTTLMEAARVAYEADGFVVAGASTQGVAAQNLQAASSISSRTVAQWRWRIDHKDGLNGIDVLILDEAGMTHDRDRAALYRAAKDSGTKIVEIFDPKQLRGVGCGSMVAVVHKMVDGGALLDNRRQADEDERAAVAAWREGNYVEALTSWADRDRLIVGKTSQDTTAAMLATWIDQRIGAPDPHTEMLGLLMVASTNEQVNRLNAGAQAVREVQGELGRGRTYDLPGGHTLHLHENDHVLVRINERHTDDPDALNGYRGVINHIDDTGHLAVTWTRAIPGGHVRESRTFDPSYVAKGGLTHGYALTVHKSQGLNINETWTGEDDEQRGGAVLFHAPGADNRSFLVATSRHTQAVWTFASQQDFETPQDTYMLGEPDSAFARRRRVITKMVERAVDTENNANDRPVLVDLKQLKDPFPKPKPSDSNTPQAGRHAASAEQRATAEELLRDVWRDHEGVQAVTNGSAFDTVARLIDRLSSSTVDPRDTLVRINPAVMVRPDVRDASRLVVAALKRIAKPSKESEHGNGASALTHEEQLRDQAADLLREAWNDHPNIELVIAGSAFGALAHNLARAADAGHDPRDVLAAIDPQALKEKVNPAAFVAWRIRTSTTTDARAITVDQERAGLGVAARLNLLIPSYERTMAHLQPVTGESPGTNLSAPQPVRVYGMWPSWLPRPPKLAALEGRDRALASAATADAKRIQARVVQLARDAARDRPEWVEQLGPAPEGAAQTARYLAALAILAAYREQHGLTGPEPLGGAPTSDQARSAFEAAKGAEQQARRATTPSPALAIGARSTADPPNRTPVAPIHTKVTGERQRLIDQQRREAGARRRRELDHQPHDPRRGPRPSP
ncbi:MobF family relaxase [Lentzea sp. BCCO 10_0061]|uniref:MobF family relaxase n=1 Tax=Lentzea sokolovensis TaxID=3095429 RepID=A0ABU4UM48_9PSEU|nr:MobF family relaxase [Lentzea sp. BCCO 10_0061]MDX8140558.1 MobF family relaxase [Lentzea sp. BCCO 10_0061]